ncbi:MAG TPA: DUF58 domain-containing protein [Propionicimonas sp.]|nr:DUF58 domain-containing protein [Propionicimonas sp.]
MEPSRLWQSNSAAETRTRTHTRAMGETRRARTMATAMVRLARTIERLRRASRRTVGAISRTVTAAGWLAIAVAAVGTSMGLIFGWVEWTIAGVAALTLVLLALPFLLGRADYQVELDIGDQRVVAGSEVVGQVRVRNAGRRSALPGRLDVPIGEGLLEVVLPLLRPQREWVEELVIPAHRRGVITIGPVTAVRADPVGLFRRESTFAEVHELYVHPRTVRVPSTSVGLVRDLEGNPTRHLVDSDIAFHAIRPYAQGDSRRQIHWKSTAKTGQLMVRQYEESRKSRIAVVLATSEAEYTDAEEFELAVSAAASVAVQAASDGRELSMITGAALPELIRAKVRTVNSLPTLTPRLLMDAFCTVERYVRGTSLEECCRVVSDTVPQLSLVVAVCGAPVGLHSLRQAALALPGDVEMLAVVCDEQVRPGMVRFGQVSVLRVGVLADLSQLLLRGAQS